MSSHVNMDISYGEMNDIRRGQIVDFVPGGLKVISLFSGCGGLDLGFSGGFSYLGKLYKRLSYNVIWANDLDLSACRIYQLNLGHNIIQGDINHVIDSSSLPDSADVVLGGFPCQDFSVAGKRRGLHSSRGGLYRAMVEVVRRTRPKVFIAENVKGLLSMSGVIDTIKSDFSDLGYRVDHYEIAACDYEIPQIRRRVFIIGWSSGCAADKFMVPPVASIRICAKQAISDLEKVDWNEKISHIWSRAKRTKGQGQNPIKADQPSPTIRAEHHGNIEYHYNNRRRLSVREAARIQSFPDNFLFNEVTQSSAYRMIGNAVPPVLGWHFAKTIREIL